MSFVKESCEQFVESLAAKDPVPGGGGASAMVGAIGAALGNMVGSLTVGKKKYADVQEEIRLMIEETGMLREALLSCVQKDAEVFAPLAKAYGMPKETEAERAEKALVMEKSLKDACSVPMEIMTLCCKSIELCEKFAEKGSKLAISDAGAGATLCKAALQAASLNVFINTKAMSDREYAKEMNLRADTMLDLYVTRADNVLRNVYKDIREEV